MRYVVYNKKYFFLLWLLIFVFWGCIICIVTSLLSSDRSKCGETILPEVPVYPNSLELEKSNADPSDPVGEIKYVYQTPDTFEAVRAFYESYAYCSATFLRDDDGDLVCTGGVPGDFYAYYRVEIKQQTDMTQYTLYVQWNCGMLDD